jgi:hypothetical protein
MTTTLKPNGPPKPPADAWVQRAGAQGWEAIVQLSLWRPTVGWSLIATYGGREDEASSRAHDLERSLGRSGLNRDRLLVSLTRIRKAETVILHDGPELQHLAPGVEPVSHVVSEIAREGARRLARRGDAPLPAGGLFDDVARNQMDLFA